MFQIKEEVEENDSLEGAETCVETFYMKQENINDEEVEENYPIQDEENYDVFSVYIEQEYEEKKKTQKKENKVSKNKQTRQKNQSLDGIKNSHGKINGIAANGSTNLPEDKMGDSNIRKNKESVENCKNCAQCICKNWRSQITPEYISMFEQHLYLMKNFLMSSSPMTNANDEIELYPGTNVRLPKRNILLSITKANKNPRAMVRNLVLNIFKKEELLSYQTADSLNRSKPEVQLAIIEYLKLNHNVEITSKQFVNIVNHKISEWKSKARMTEEQIEKLNAEKREKSKLYRKKRKMAENAPNSMELKK